MKIQQTVEKYSSQLSENEVVQKVNFSWNHPVVVTYLRMAAGCLVHWTSVRKMTFNCLSFLLNNIIIDV